MLTSKSKIVRKIGKIILRFYFKSGQDSLDKKEKWVQQFLRDLPSAARLLDVGAGTQKYRQYASHINYVSQDSCQYDGSAYTGVNEARNWDTSGIDIISDILEIPVDNNSFDAIICTDVLEHVPNAYDACKELRRIVRPGGHILITVPTQCDTHQAPYFFSGGYSQFFFQEIFQKDLVSVIYESGYFETVDQKIGKGLSLLIRHFKSDRKILQIMLLIAYIVASLPLVIVLRIMPRMLEEVGNSGILIKIEKGTY